MLSFFQKKTRTADLSPKKYLAQNYFLFYLTLFCKKFDFKVLLLLYYNLFGFASFSTKKMKRLHKRCVLSRLRNAGSFVVGPCACTSRGEPLKSWKYATCGEHLLSTLPNWVLSTWLHTHCALRLRPLLWNLTACGWYTKGVLLLLLRGSWRWLKASHSLCPASQYKL